MFPNLSDLQSNLPLADVLPVLVQDSESTSSPKKQKTTSTGREYVSTINCVCHGTYDTFSVPSGPGSRRFVSDVDAHTKSYQHKQLEAESCIKDSFDFHEVECQTCGVLFTSKYYKGSGVTYSSKYRDLHLKTKFHLSYVEYQSDMQLWFETLGSP